MTSELYVGLMSGTSLDGVDAVLACFEKPEIILASSFLPFPDVLRNELQSLLGPGDNEIHRGALAANRLSDFYATAVRDLLVDAGQQPQHIRAIGCHGQTIRHDPAHAYTVQLVNGARLAEATGIQVACDFRSRDIAAGGQGAPLVPAFHARVFSHPSITRAIVNIGGIANVTYLPPDGQVIGFDCGPGNALMDEWIAEQRGANYDEGGAWGAQGAAIPALLGAWIANPYFGQTPPKSTGRDLFNLKWARPHLRPEHQPADVQATLADLTAGSIADAIERFCPETEEVFVCGGGASNTHLMRRLAAHLPTVTWSTTAALGIHPDWVEAVAFAWLARETLAGRPGNLPAVTGAAGLRVLGCVYPA